MWKLINPKNLSFQIEVENKKFIDDYLLRKPYSFSGFVREVIQKETNKHLSIVTIESLEYNFKPSEKLDKNIKYEIVSLKIEEIDLRILKHLSRKNRKTVSHIVRELINKEIENIKRGEI